jgi:HK97 gp10 family phage protein
MPASGITARTVVSFHLNPRLVPQVIASPEVRAVFLMLALRVEREARRRAPVDTGRLRNSITHRVYGTEYAIVAEIGTDVEYAIYQEFGTAHVPATRFLGGALQAVAQQLGGIM